MPRRLLASAVPGLATLLLGLWAHITGLWSTLGVPVPSGGPHFGDLRIVMIASQCAAADPAWNLETPPCDPGMAIYNYPSIWAKALGAFGADGGWTTNVAVVLVVVFALSLSTLTFLALRHGSQTMTVTAMTMAGLLPPVLLGYERGNIDLAVFGVLTVSIALYVWGAARSSAVALGIATALKLFPLGGAAMLMMRGPRRTSTLVVFAVTASLGLAFVVRDLIPIAARTPQIDGASFGAGLLPILASTRLHWPPTVGTAKMLGLILLAVSILVIAIAARAARGTRAMAACAAMAAELRADRTSSALVLAGGGTFVMAYIVGPSYDYRLIFLIPAIAGLVRLSSSLARWAAVLLLLQMLLSYSTFIGAAEYASDLMLLVIVPVLILLGWNLIRPRPVAVS